MRRMPERPSMRFAQMSVALCPRALTMPTPVTTTRRPVEARLLTVRPECTSGRRYVLHHFRKPGGDLSREEAGAAVLLAQGFAGGAVEIDAKACRFERRRALGQVAADHAGEDVAAAGGGQERVRKRAQRRASVGRGDDAVSSFEHDGAAVLHGGLGG